MSDTRIVDDVTASQLRKLPLVLDRTFWVQQLASPHWSLLVRSPREFGGHAERIDLLFTGVKALKLRIALPSLSVRRPTGEERACILAELGDNTALSGGLHLYIVEDSLSTGYVVAHRLSVSTDLHEGNVPSLLWSRLVGESPSAPQGTIYDID